MKRKQFLFFLPICIALFMAAGAIVGSYNHVHTSAGVSHVEAQIAGCSDVSSFQTNADGSDPQCDGVAVCNNGEPFCTCYVCNDQACVPTCDNQCGGPDGCGGTCGSTSNPGCEAPRCPDGSLAPGGDPANCCQWSCADIGNACGTYLQCGQLFDCGTCPPPPQTCTDPNANNYGDPLPCTYTQACGFSCDQVLCGTYRQCGQDFNCGTCITSCPTGQRLVNNTCIDDPVVCPDSSTFTEDCDPGYIGSVTIRETYGPSPACTPQFTQVSNTCTPANSTISVSDNISGGWSVNGQNGSGSSSITVNPNGGTLYTITPANVPGYNYPPTVTNSVTGSGSSFMLFGGDSGTFTLSYTAAPPPFDYSLSNSGAVSVYRGGIDTYGQNTITKTITSGSSQSVSLAVSPTIPGVDVSMSGGGVCGPTCANTITFTVHSSATPGDYTMTVTGSPLGHTTSFPLHILNSTAVSVSCTASPSPAMVGQSITWTGNVSGGIPPYTYSWSGTNIPSGPAPTTNPYSITYTTVGVKTATLTATDSIGNQGSCSAPVGSVQVNFNPQFKEI